jgi:hypothetical protein
MSIPPRVVRTTAVYPWLRIVLATLVRASRIRLRLTARKRFPCQPCRSITDRARRTLR